MTVASQLVAVNEWLTAIGNQPIYIGVNGGTEPITKERLLNLAQRCEWARIEEEARLPGVFPQRLVMGYGDFLEWCRSGGQSESAKAYFLTAFSG